ncbi:hypothetical protein NLU13_3812 [Sarocladium strictum]|uniref:Uncharacterized protein n=1 Tax=Sarocladium strictum TaxID=5046 RepID=A0AA39GIC9_SARSR|nr:hypothetical protein NLU13_3812 [Sarocladium strictum]
MKTSALIMSCLGSAKSLLHTKNPILPHDGPPQYLEEYRSPSYVPSVTKTESGRFQVISPPTPYVASVGRTALFYLDTRFPPETAAHIKRQIEEKWIHIPTGYTYIDEVTVTVEKKRAETDEVLFVFDRDYAKVLYAKEFNKLDPALELPEYNLYCGDWVRDFSEQIGDKENEVKVFEELDRELAREAQERLKGSENSAE